MEPNKSLFTVTKSNEQKNKDILTNVLIMLSNRIYIDKNGEKHNLITLPDARKKLEDRDDNTYVLKANNGNMYVIKIVNYKISTTGKQSFVSEFLKEYAEYKKIIVAQDYKKLIADYVSKQRTQIFKEDIMLSNLIDHIDQPKFELLSPNEMALVKQEYNTTDYTTKKYLRTDPIPKYFALKKGDVIRIIRPSPTSGQSIDYRIVV